MPFLLGMALCCSAGFATPVAHECTLLVMGPGGYRFRHFVAVGGPLAALTWLVTVIAVPLLDMKRYNKLLAGASWMAEYGNPDKPDEWAYISKYSPYQNVEAGVEYPRPLFTTTTRDDRVHPGHARKMAAKMESLGQEVWYYENLEGGHGGSSTNDQLAYRLALAYAHLWKQLD